MTTYTIETGDGLTYEALRRFVDQWRLAAPTGGVIARQLEHQMLPQFEVGDVCHVSHSKWTFEANMTVVAVHGDKVWAVDGDGDDDISLASRLTHGPRPS